jgi:hypothetical protein
MQRPSVCPTMNSSLGFDWTTFQTGLNEVTNAIDAYNPQPGTIAYYQRYGGTPPAGYAVPQTMLGGSTGTLLLVGGGLILVYALISKRR